MQATKTRHSTGELISRTETAEMIGGGLAVFSAKWYRLISDPAFPPLHYMTQDESDRGYYKRSEIQAYIDSL